MTRGIEENNDPLIALHSTAHTRTQGHGKVDRPLQFTRLDTDVEVPLSRHPAVIRPIRTLIVLTDLKTQPGARSQLDQIDESRLDFLAGFIESPTLIRDRKATPMSEHPAGGAASDRSAGQCTPTPPRRTPTPSPPDTKHLAPST